MDLMSTQLEKNAREKAIASKPIVSATQDPIRLENAGLDERDGEIIAHGWLDIDAMGRLLVDPDYQREVMSVRQSRKGVARAVAEGVRLPDIMLGMRGSNYDAKGHSMLLRDRVYIVDGLQRIAALKAYAEKHPDEASSLRIGAEVRFSTTKESERELFINLNTSRIPVSPNVILRNMKSTKNPGILTIYGLSTADKNFALYNRVTWTQRMARGDLLTATILARVGRSLHIFNSSNPQAGAGSSRADTLVSALNDTVETIGMNTFRGNIAEFFDIVDACWGLRNIAYADKATQLRGNFLVTLARVFADHTNFWNPGTDELFVDAATKKKLAAFPLLDPEISRLAAAGSMTVPMLYGYIVDHLNKGRKSNRLRKRTENK